MPEQSAENPAGKVPASLEATGAVWSVAHAAQYGFLGNPTTKLDERGRLKLPAEFRPVLDQRYGKGFNDFYITSRDGKSAEIYPLPEWLKVKAVILAMPHSLRARGKVLDNDTAYGDRASMDPQGRMVIPALLRSKAELEGEVKVYGEGHMLRVTRLKKILEAVESEPLDDNDLAQLAQYGL